MVSLQLIYHDAYKPIYGIIASELELTIPFATFFFLIFSQFSVGATLGKGLNRMLATLSAGALGVGVHHLATLSGEKGEPIVLGFFIAMIGNMLQTVCDNLML